MKLQKVIALLCAVSALVLCGCGTVAPETTNETVEDTVGNDLLPEDTTALPPETTALSLPETTAGDNSLPEEKSSATGVVVYDAFFEEVPLNGYEGDDACCYHIPAVKVDGVECANINGQIYNKLYSRIQEALAETKQQNSPAFESSIRYVTYEHDGLLSIVIWSQSFWVSDTGYYIYNVDPYEDRIVSSEDVLSSLNYTQEDVWNEMKRQLPEYYRNTSGEMSYDSQLQKTISGLSMDKVRFFVGPDGKLCLEFSMYQVFGGEYKNVIWDIEAGGELIPEAAHTHAS